MSRLKPRPTRIIFETSSFQFERSETQVAISNGRQPVTIRNDSPVADHLLPVTVHPTGPPPSAYPLACRDRWAWKASPRHTRKSTSAICDRVRANSFLELSSLDRHW